MIGGIVIMREVKQETAAFAGG